MLRLFSAVKDLDWLFESMLGATLMVNVATMKEIKMDARALDLVFIFNLS
jgi:hypothetical protein